MPISRTARSRQVLSFDDALQQARAHGLAHIVSVLEQARTDHFHRQLAALNAQHSSECEHESRAAGAPQEVITIGEAQARLLVRRRFMDLKRKRASIDNWRRKCVRAPASLPQGVGGARQGAATESLVSPALASHLLCTLTGSMDNRSSQQLQRRCALLDLARRHLLQALVPALTPA